MNWSGSSTSRPTLLSDETQVLRCRPLVPATKTWTKGSTEDGLQTLLPTTTLVVERVASDALQCARVQGEPTGRPIEPELQVYEQTLVATIAPCGKVLTI